MSKSKHFFGQSVFGQLISLISPDIINRAVKKHRSDYRIKKFSTSDHLISMLFSVFSQSVSLREVAGAMLGLKGKTEHFQLRHIPRRSTLSDANKRRCHKVFAEIYYSLYKRYKHIISDSRNYSWEEKVEIIDSTIIGLFKDILACSGRSPANGKRKGGIKVHSQIHLQERVPKMIWISSATTHDSNFMSNLKFERGAIVVFDRGYNDYEVFESLDREGVYFVTRLKTNARYEPVEEIDIADEVDTGVLKDESIKLEIKQQGKESKNILLRRVAYWDNENQRCFEFITNIKDIDPGQIALIYKKRWVIELLFKQLKQNFPLRYFLGDNENAIKIQIWCVLIVNLLFTVIRKRLKRKWSFSNLVSFCRLHLFNYIHLMRFLEHPEKDWIKETRPLQPGLLFNYDSG